MHSAPAVIYPVGRSRFQGWLLGLFGLGGVVAGLLWRYQATPAGWRQWLFALTLICACAFAADAWRRSPRGSLRWDGQVWSWTSIDRSVCGVLAVHLDLQSLLLLSLRLDCGARIWFWPQRGTDVTAWNALRRAVFSRATPVHTPDSGADVDWAGR